MPCVVVLYTILDCPCYSAVLMELRETMIRQTRDGLFKLCVHLSTLNFQLVPVPILPSPASRGAVLTPNVCISSSCATLIAHSSREVCHMTNDVIV